MSSKRKSPPTKFTPDDLSNGLHTHRTPSDALDPHHPHPFTTPPIPEVEENPLNLQQVLFDSNNRLTNEVTFEDDEEENFLDNMTSSPGASDSCSPYPSRLADQDSDSATSDPEGRCDVGALGNSGASSAFAHTSRKQRLLQSVSDSSGKALHHPAESDSDSDAGCYSGSECGLSSNMEQRLSSPGQSRTMEPVPSPGSSHHSDVGSGRPVNRRSMDDVVKKLTSKMHTSASLNDTVSGLRLSEFDTETSNRKQTNGDNSDGRPAGRVLVESDDLKVTLSNTMSISDKQKILSDLIDELQKVKASLDQREVKVLSAVYLNLHIIWFLFEMTIEI
ncbi:transcription factor Sox-6 [Caerostris extrusa]|uniref:Transcription factor Sox-6 n=1 Tax=Caerostris extrusa TaxID=172846 RepID=A0AAV4UGG6_CAEEX|nr:transcription factor Sox-6 [Caerostris extrusa]